MTKKPSDTGIQIREGSGAERCSVRLLVKELDGTYEATVEGVYRAYDAKPVKKLPDGTCRQVLSEKDPDGPTPGTFETTLRDLIESVKDSAVDVYL